MSWDSYMGTLDGYCGNVLKYGAIYGIDDGARWTSKGEGFNPDQNEIRAVIDTCKQEKPALEKVYTEGVRLGGKKYKFIRADPDEKCISFTTSDGDGKVQNGNAIITNKTVIVGICEEKEKSAKAAIGTAQLANYLKSTGY